MRVGILLCGGVPSELESEFGNYTNCLTSQLNLGLYDKVNVWNVYQHHQLPGDASECDVYVIGGSPSGVNDALEWIHSLTLFVRKAFFANKKLFGICFGHQIIHHALGGKVRKADQGWGLGIYDVPLKEDIGELNAGRYINLIAIHQDQVVKLGGDFEVLAGNEFCPNYITRFKNQVLTVQGHPEFSGQFFNALIMQRTDQFNEEQIAKAKVRGKESIEASIIFNRFAHKFLFD